MMSNKTKKITISFRRIFHAISLIFLLQFGTIPVGAQEVTWDDEQFRALFLAGEYDEAFELINQPDLTESMSLFQQRGILLGSGLLSSGRNLCGSILNLEMAFSLGGLYVEGALDFLYGGDWAGIAALEGNVEALYIVGRRTFFSVVQSNPFLALDKSVGATRSYVYFYTAAKLGHQPSVAMLRTIQLQYPEIDFGPHEQSLVFKEVICPVREY